MPKLVQTIKSAKSFPKNQHGKVIWLNSPSPNQTLKLTRLEIHHRYQYQFCGFDLDNSSLHGIQSEKNVMQKLKNLVIQNPNLFQTWQISNDCFHFSQQTSINQAPTQIYQNLIDIANAYYQNQKVRS